MSKLLIIFIMFLIFKVIILNEIEQNDPYPIDIEVDLWTNNVGKKGIIVFRVNTDYGTDDMKRITMFKKKIIGQNNTSYEVSCGPWMCSKEFIIFCEFNENIPKGVYYLQFDKENDIFYYDIYEIHLSSFPYNITKLDSDQIDLYFDPQTINVTDDKDIYEMNFKILTYSQDRLYFPFVYDEPLNCKKKSNELICSIKKDTLEGVSSFLNNEFEILKIYKYDKIFSYDKYGNKVKLYLTPSMKVNFDITKIDVYVRITKLLTNYTEIDNFLAYETNVTNIPSMLALTVFGFMGKEKDKGLSCYFKKGEIGPLLLLCRNLNEDELYLEEIKTNINLTVNNKYNFIILPVNITETIIFYQKNILILLYEVFIQLF